MHPLVKLLKHLWHVPTVVGSTTLVQSLIGLGFSDKNEGLLKTSNGQKANVEWDQYISILDFDGLVYLKDRTEWMKNHACI